LRKAKTGDVTPAKAGVQSEKAGYPLQRDLQVLFPQQEIFNRKCHNEREALIAGRTAVWFKNQIIGRPNYLHAIFKKAVQIDKPYLRRGDTTCFEVTNNSDIDIQVQSLGQGGPGKLTLPANAITMIKTKVESKAEKAQLKYQITNFLVAPNKGLPINLNVSLK